VPHLTACDALSAGDFFFGPWVRRKRQEAPGKLLGVQRGVTMKEWSWSLGGKAPA